MREALREDEKNGDFWSVKGQLGTRIGNDEEVVEDFSRAILCDVQRAEFWFRRGFAKFNLQQFQEAIED